LISREALPLIFRIFERNSTRLTPTFVQYRTVVNCLHALANLSENGKLLLSSRLPLASNIYPFALPAENSHESFLALQPAASLEKIIATVPSPTLSGLAYDSLRILVNLGLKSKSRSLLPTRTLPTEDNPHLFCVSAPHNVNLFYFDLLSSIEEFIPDTVDGRPLPAGESKDWRDSIASSPSRRGLFPLKRDNGSLTNLTIDSDSGSQEPLAAASTASQRSGSGSSTSPAVIKSGYLVDIIKYIVTAPRLDEKLLHSFVFSYRTFSTAIVVLRILFHV